jgi:hypothetical protein
VAAYEALRQTALEEVGGIVRRTAGLAVVLRAGVVAWMQTCRTVANSIPLGRSGDTVTSLPGGVRAEVATLLAEMALAATVEMVT